jgi:hypothetical protein
MTEAAQVSILSVPLTAVERFVLTDTLVVVPEVSRRLSRALGERFDPERHAPRIDKAPGAPLLIPRVALGTTVAALLDADAQWHEGRVRGFVYRLIEAIDEAAAQAGWL